MAESDLRQHCGARLPAYMVPSRFIWLEDIPVNANGKADRRSVASLLGEAVARAS
jgi:D-alanine--poly(phosphoribitol) ligase subunit 1